MESTTTTVISIADWIQFGVLTIALWALVYQISSQRKEANESRNRTIYLLEIFKFLHDEAKTENEIIDHIKTVYPKVDVVYIKKTLYDMLIDETLRFRSNKTYKLRRNKARDEKEEAADGG